MIDIYVCKMIKLFGLGGGGEEGYLNIVFSVIFILFFYSIFV